MSTTSDSQGGSAAPGYHCEHGVNLEAGGYCPPCGERDAAPVLDAAPGHCGTKGCPNAPTEKVPDAKLSHVVYDLCASCAAGMRALQNVPLIDAKNVPPLTFEPVAASSLEQAVNAEVCSVCEGHEDDHTGCANAVQHFLSQSEAARDQLRRTVQAVNDNALGWHAGEDGKARALNVIAVWTSEALAGRLHPSVEAITDGR